MWLFSLLNWTCRCTAQSSPHWEDFPSPLFFRGVAEKGCSAVEVYFGVMSAYHAEPFINQACVFSSSVNASLGPEQAGREKPVAGVGTMNIWTTFPHKLLVLSGASWAWSCIYHLYLMMKSCDTHPTLGLGGLDSTYFMKGSLDSIVTWWPVVKLSVSTKAPKQVKSCFSKGG